MIQNTVARHNDVHVQSFPINKFYAEIYDQVLEIIRLNISKLLIINI